MSDSEAPSSPPPAPVEDKSQPERKVIGGYREGGRAANQSGQLFQGLLPALSPILNTCAFHSLELCCNPLTRESCEDGWAIPVTR